MNYFKEAISELDCENKDRYVIYLVHGTGVVEDPHHEGATVNTIECSEFEAWLTAEYLNLQMWGPIKSRSSWESPNYSYKKV
jgi:hypothetical protein